jgi:hypothetical protein
MNPRLRDPRRRGFFVRENAARPAGAQARTSPKTAGEVDVGQGSSARRTATHCARGGPHPRPESRTLSRKRERGYTARAVVASRAAASPPHSHCSSVRAEAAGASPQPGATFTPSPACGRGWRGDEPGEGRLRMQFDARRSAEILRLQPTPPAVLGEVRAWASGGGAAGAVRSLRTTNLVTHLASEPPARYHLRNQGGIHLSLKKIR